MGSESYSAAYLTASAAIFVYAGTDKVWYDLMFACQRCKALCTILIVPSGLMIHEKSVHNPDSSYAKWCSNGQGLPQYCYCLKGFYFLIAGR